MLNACARQITIIKKNIYVRVLYDRTRSQYFTHRHHRCRWFNVTGIYIFFFISLDRILLSFHYPT